MSFDRNPKYGVDQSFVTGARRATDFLWEMSGGDVSNFPRSYLENLRHDFSDGRVSMLELIDRVDLGPNATYEEYCEVVDALMFSEPSQFPHPDSVIRVNSDALLYELDVDFSESDFDFAESDLSSQVEKFLKKCIASVYLDGVADVTDSNGNPPNEENNYLLSDDGKEFSGVFYGADDDDEQKSFPFTISENGGTWRISY